MDIRPSLLIAPCLIFSLGCSSHYSASVSSYDYYDYGPNVSVGVHGHGHGGAEVLGAMVVGGMIGYMISESGQDEANRASNTAASPDSRGSGGDDTDALVNGYPIDSGVKPEQPENSKWYQLGKDGNCYLMQNQKGQPEIVSMVPRFSCPE